VGFLLSGLLLQVVLAPPQEMNSHLPVNDP